jgi:hypothetical protein
MLRLGRAGLIKMADSGATSRSSAFEDRLRLIGIALPMSVFYGAPLWPAGHLPHGWGDWPLSRLSLISNV